MKYLVQLIFLFLISGCTSELEDEVNTLVKNKNKWIMSVPDRNYSYTYRHKCFCSYNDEDINIKVENGSVVSVTLANGENINDKRFKTIKQHFEHILEIIKLEEWEGRAKIKVEYDKELGYPSFIEVNKHVMDGSYLLNISNVIIE